MSALRSRTERCAPRRSVWFVSSPNQRSTRFSQELDVGVKCGTNLGWARSNFRIAGVLCVEDKVDLALRVAVQRLEHVELDRAVA